mmetsp:Transcript_44732/g.114384  ORF Transcript_44732/g.114384 Transcript_44732/m.114384 type:complete len:297 (+) Transcript_44732:310-1200(+)
MESLAGRAGDKLQCLYHHVGPVDDGSNICQATQGGGGVARLERLQQLLPLDLLVLRLRARHDVQRVPRGHVGADEAAEKVKRVAANLVVRHDEHVAARCDLVGVAGARLHGDRLAGPLVDGALEHGPFVLLTQPRQQVLRVRLVLQQAPAQRRLAREGDAVGERVGCDVRDVQLGVQGEDAGEEAARRGEQLAVRLRLQLHQPVLPRERLHVVKHDLLHRVARIRRGALDQLAGGRDGAGRRVGRPLLGGVHRADDDVAVAAGLVDGGHLRHLPQTCRQQRVVGRANSADACCHHL